MHIGTKSLLSLGAAFFIAWLGLKYLLPLFSPFVLGAVLALAAEPMVRFLCRTGLPRGVGAGIGVSMAFAFLALILLLLGAFLVRELGNLAGVLPDLASAANDGISLLQQNLLELSSHAPGSIRPLLETNVNGLFSGGATLLDQLARYLLGLAGTILSHVPDSALSLGTGIISAYLISSKLPKIRRFLLKKLPRDRLRQLLAAAKKMKHAMGGWLLAQCKLMGVTFCILAAGFLLLRIPHALAWAAGAALVDAFPVLGTGTVLLPWCLISLLQKDTPRALGLLGIYALVTLTRSVLEPRLVGRHMGLDPLITLAALYVGFQLWGIGGMILAPLLTAAVCQLNADLGRRK